MMKLLPLGIAMLAAGASAAARTPVSVPTFHSINLRGSGHVVVRHGAQQSVTLVRGDLQTTRLRVDERGRLEIDTCVRTCPDYDLAVEIVTPEIQGVGVDGSGDIRAEGAFPDRDSLVIGVRGSGEIDMLAISAASVAAGINGGGEIRTHARDRLVAGIDGGGEIRYRGDPNVTSGINGGGSIRPIGAE